MKMRSLFAGLTIMVCLGLIARISVFAASDQEMKTVAVVSIAGYDALEEGIAKEFEVVGYKETFSAMTTMLGEIDGLDKNKPAGFVLLYNGKEFVPFGFLPVADFDALTCPGLEALMDKAEYDEEAGTLTFADDEKKEENPLFASEKGRFVLRLIEKDGWLYVTPDAFAGTIPVDGDPTALLEGLNAKYDIGAIIHIENIPTDLVESLFAPIRQKIAAADAGLSVLFETYGKCLDFVCANYKTIEMGAVVDQANGDFTVSSVAAPLEGSPLAETLKMNQNPQTLWSDFYKPDGAVIAGISSLKASPGVLQFQKDSLKSSLDQQIAQLETSIEDEKFLEMFKRFFVNLQDWMMKNDGLNDSAFTFGSDGIFMMAGTVTAGDELTGLIQEWVEGVKNWAKDMATQESEADDQAKIEEMVEKVFGSLKINDSKYEGYSVSTFVVTDELLDALDAPFPNLSGIALLLGVKDDAVIVLAGPDKKGVSDLFKEKAAMKRTMTSSPQSGLFSLPNLGSFLRLCEPDGEGVFKWVTDALIAGNSEAVILMEKSVREEIAAETITIKGEFFRLVGDAVRAAFRDEAGDETIEGDDLFDDEETEETAPAE